MRVHMWGGVGNRQKEREDEAEKGNWLQHQYGCTSLSFWGYFLFTCIFIYMDGAGPVRVNAGAWRDWRLPLQLQLQQLWVTGCVWWELNWGPLQEQCTLWTDKPPLQPCINYPQVFSGLLASHQLLVFSLARTSYLCASSALSRAQRITSTGNNMFVN